MAEVTVSQLAESIDTPVDRLLQQMSEAGLPHASATDAVSMRTSKRCLPIEKQRMVIRKTNHAK